MDEIIKEQLDKIELAAQRIAHEAQNISLRITAIFGYTAGRESGVEYWLKCSPNAHFQQVFDNSIIPCNGYQEIVSQPPSAEKSVEEIIQEVKEMIIELKIKGSVRLRSNGLIEFRSNALGSIYGRTKEEIEQKITAKLKETSKEKRTRQTKKTVKLLSEFYKDCYIPYKRNQNLKEGSLLRIASTFKYIVEHNFDKPLTAYTPQSIEAFLYSIKKTRKRQITQNLLNNMFNRAVAESLLKTNPSASIDKMKHTAREGSALSFEEQYKFFEYLLSSKKISDTHKYYYLFVYLTGSRRNEALASISKDCDFKNKTLKINGTKTDGSLRQIPLFPLLEKLMLKIKPNENGINFPISEYSTDDIYKGCMKVLGINHKLHDLRHSFGTIKICVEKINTKTVSLWMGHSTINTTLQIYTHPEKLDKSTFLRGDLTEDEKIAIYRSKYNDVLKLIEAFL